MELAVGDIKVCCDGDIESHPSEAPEHNRPVLISDKLLLVSKDSMDTMDTIHHQWTRNILDTMGLILHLTGH